MASSARTPAPRGDALARVQRQQLAQLAERKHGAAAQDRCSPRGEEATPELERTAADPRGRRRAANARPTLEAKRIAGASAARPWPTPRRRSAKSYVYGAAGPERLRLLRADHGRLGEAGVSLPHNSSAQYSSGRHISESELQPGDLVFYYSPISHVGMYIGNGQIVNALNPGSGVQVSGLHDMPYSGAVRPG